MRSMRPNGESTLETYAYLVIGTLPVASIDVGPYHNYPRADLEDEGPRRQAA